MSSIPITLQHLSGLAVFFLFYLFFGLMIIMIWKHTDTYQEFIIGVVLFIITYCVLTFLLYVSFMIWIYLFFV